MSQHADVAVPIGSKGDRIHTDRTDNFPFPDSKADEVVVLSLYFSNIRARGSI